METNLPNKTHLTEEPGPDSYKIQAPKLKVKGNALDTLLLRESEVPHHIIIYNACYSRQRQSYGLDPGNYT